MFHEKRGGDVRFGTCRGSNVTATGLALGALVYTGAYVQSSPRQLCDGFEQQVIHSAPGYPVFDVHERLARLPVVAARCTVDFADGTTPDRATLVIDWQANLTVLAGVILMIAAVAYHFRHRHDVT